MIEVLLIFCGFWILYACLYRVGRSLGRGLGRYLCKPGQAQIPFPTYPPVQLREERKHFMYTENGQQYIAYEGSETYNLILKALNKK